MTSIPLSDTQIFQGLGAMAAAVAFAYAIYLFIRRSGGPRARGELSEDEIAYLVGGPARAMECATYSLAREGWIRADGHGVFRSQYEEVDGRLSAIESELMQAMIDSGGCTVAQVVRLRLQSLSEVERTLISRGLILKTSMLGWASFIASVPVMAEIAFAVYLLLRAHRGPEQVMAGALIVALSLIFGRVRAFFTPITDLGEKKRAEIRAGVARRRLASQQQGEDARYDRLWALKDDVLLGGLRSIIGSSFAPASSFVSESAAEQPRSRRA